MRVADIDADVVAVVVARLPGKFRTRDVSEAEEMLTAHPGAHGDSGFPALVGRRLSQDRLELGIFEASKGGSRGSTWHKGPSGGPDIDTTAASRGSEAPSQPRRSRAPCRG